MPFHIRSIIKGQLKNDQETANASQNNIKRCPQGLYRGSG
jgi:hypothetical protein